MTHLTINVSPACAVRGCRNARAPGAQRFLDGPLDSTWLIKTEQTPKEVRDVLKPLIDANDEPLVIDVSGRTAAWTGFNQRGSD